MKIFLLIPLLVLLKLPAASGEEPEIEEAKPIEGVFFTRGWHNQVIELKDGKFRYWFNSDAKGSDVEGLEGTYIVKGDTVSLEHPDLIPLVSIWQALSIDGVVTLWRSDALEFRAKGELDLYSGGKARFFAMGGGSILVPSKETAERTWAPAAPMTQLTEVQLERAKREDAERDGAGQPDTAVDSKAEGKEQDEPESEGRSK